MRTDDDLILFLTRELRRLEPGISVSTVATVATIEERMRATFGGERVYVAKPADRRAAQRHEQVLCELRAGRSAREVAHDAHLSVRTVYRIKLRMSSADLPRPQ